MKCPIDGTPLHITERSGVEIDYCPACRGVWLDRGELDKIIERADAGARTPPRPAPGGYERGGKPDKKKKRRGFDLLEDLFDF